MPLGERNRAHAAKTAPAHPRSAGELLVRAGDVLPEVKAGNISAPASLPRVREPTDDAGELVQGLSPAPDRLGRRSPRKLLRAVVARLLGRKS
jgi:hypothetical protein